LFGKTIRCGNILDTGTDGFIGLYLVYDNTTGLILPSKPRGSGDLMNLGIDIEYVQGNPRIITKCLNAKIMETLYAENMRHKTFKLGRLWIVNSKIEKFFNWQPTYIGIKESKSGLIKTIDQFIQPYFFIRRNLQFRNVNFPLTKVKRDNK
jgi:hypothetical protein